MLQRGLAVSSQQPRPRPRVGQRVGLFRTEHAQAVDADRTELAAGGPEILVSRRLKLPRHFTDCKRRQKFSANVAVCSVARHDLFGRLPDAALYGDTG